MLTFPEREAGDSAAGTGFVSNRLRQQIRTKRSNGRFDFIGVSVIALRRTDRMTGIDQGERQRLVATPDGDSGGNRGADDVC